jgi:hypothetical protein
MAEANGAFRIRQKLIDIIGHRFLGIILDSSDESTKFLIVRNMEFG